MKKMFNSNDSWQAFQGYSRITRDVLSPGAHPGPFLK